MSSEDISPRARLVALLLCIFLGIFGAHRFYVGKIGTAILMMCTLGGFGIWTMVDIIFIVCGIFRDQQQRRVFKWFEEGSI